MTILIHKPIGQTSTDTISLVKKDMGIQDLYPIDHLHEETEGLLILTENSTSPTLPSEYEVIIDQYLSRQAQNMLPKGLVTSEQVIPGIELIEEKHKGKRSVVHLKAARTTDTQLRTLFETIGYHVISIRRIRLGDFKLGVLSAGRWKKIN